MAFNEKEQSIIQWGLQNGKSKEDVSKAIQNFRVGTTNQKPVNVPVQAPAQKSPGYFERVTNSVGDDINKRVDRVAAIQARPTSETMFESGPIKTDLKSAQIVGQGAGMAAHALETVVGEIPGVKQVFSLLGKAMSKLKDNKAVQLSADNISESKLIQDLTTFYDNDPNFKDTVDGIANVIRLGGDVSATLDTANGIKAGVDKIKKMILPAANEPTVTVGGKTLTHNQINTSEGVEFMKKLSPADQKILTDFDHLQTAKQTLDHAIKVGASPEDIQGLQTAYSQLKSSISPSSHGSMSGIDTISPLNTILKDAKVPLSEEGLANSAISGIKGVGKNIVNDILPTTERFINTEVTKALDLTQGDVKNISLSTGNDVGKFLADKNLIGNNLAETTKNISNFYKENYNIVRSEIGKVGKIYSIDNIPQYKEALLEIKKLITETPGLQKDNAVVDLLSGRNKITLSNIQKAKELLDEYFTLYKATGDVKEGVTKQGLANIRNDLKTFIEREVKNETGADIKGLNNNVQTARSIVDAIETRSTRGLTRATISAGDVMTFLTGSALGTPAGGAIAVILKKIYQSPSFKLKLSKWLDGISDARRAKIIEDIESGVVPKDLQSLLDGPKSTIA